MTTTPEYSPLFLQLGNQPRRCLLCEDSTWVKAFPALGVIKIECCGVSVTERYYPHVIDSAERVHRRLLQKHRHLSNLIYAGRQ